MQRVMELLATPMPGNDLRLALAAPMLGLLEADFYASYVWDASARRFEQGVALNLNPVHGQRYEEQFQFDDPLTPRLLARRAPTRATDVLPQSDLQATAFFNDFLRPDGLHWGVNAYAHDGARHLGDLRIWRRRSRPNFDDDDLAVLRMLYPALVQALARNATERACPAQPSRDSLTDRLMQCTVLSRREAEVSALACEGLADKDIARALGIGFTTVRTHLAAAFRKLDCDGRNRLAHRVAQLTPH
ncbi:MAG: helix-turn-helix transcriptional regulator [Burkholderiaceae bacterium]